MNRLVVLYRPLVIFVLLLLVLQGYAQYKWFKSLDLYFINDSTEHTAGFADQLKWYQLEKYIAPQSNILMESFGLRFQPKSDQNIYLTYTHTIDAMRKTEIGLSLSNRSIFTITLNQLFALDQIVKRDKP